MPAFEARLVLLLVHCSECCWRTSTEKNTFGIARFPCGSTAFLLNLLPKICVRQYLVQKRYSEFNGVAHFSKLSKLINGHGATSVQRQRLNAVFDTVLVN